jgi:hypothetical protein
MSDVGSKVLGIMAVCAGGIVLFSPLAAVLVAAASKGRGRVLAWAFAGSFFAALACLAVAAGLYRAVSPQVAGWWMLGSPWLSALGAVAGWKGSLRAAQAAEAQAGTGERRA